MTRSKPPFRADHVGSFLRPLALKEARAKRDKGEITADQLRKVEDEEIKKLIQKQEEIGLKVVTDGEFRRSWWHFDFLGGLDGVELYEADQGIQFKGVQTKAQAIRVTGKVGFPNNHPFLEHFKFVKANTKVTPKITIPGPTVLHFRQSRQAISMKAYPEIDAFFADAGKAWGKAVRAFYDAGCRYLQFDDTVWAYLCSPSELAKSKERGHDPETLQAKYAAMINAALKEKPGDMAITTHVCRGNFRSTWISEGGYEPVAEVMLGQTNYDGYFLEYDTERAGGFEPMRFLPKGNKQVVLGPDHLEKRLAGKEGRREETDRRSGEIRPARPVLPVAAMRLRLDRGGQYPDRGAAMGKDAGGRRAFRGGLGQIAAT